MITRNISILLLTFIIIACSKDNHILGRDSSMPKLTAATNCIKLMDITEQGISKAGVIDRQDFRIPKYPYLRINRFLSSYRNEVQNHKFSSWVGLLQQLGIIGWEIELKNLPRQDKIKLDKLAADLFPKIPSVLSKLAYCSDILRDELSLEANRHALKLSAIVPSVYNTWQQILGLYPLTAIAFRIGISRWHQETLAIFNSPLASLPVEGKLVVYAPDNNLTKHSLESVSDILQKSAKNPLHIPLPTESQQQVLFARFAPSFEIDVVSENDKMGAPYWGEHGQVLIDTQKPTIYQQISHTRINDKTLLQLNYMFWFPSRPKSWSMDLLGGHLDGIIWRVTLNTDGNPLIFDTIHSCGCYHLFFTSQYIQVAKSSSLYTEPFFSPQKMTVSKDQEFVIRISSNNHAIQKIYIAPASSKQKQLYQFDSADNLRSITLANGQNRSLYNQAGFITGTERGERYLFWPMGIPNPGAMRQWGHHATAFVGRRHFDDARLFEENFELLVGDSDEN